MNVIHGFLRHAFELIYRTGVGSCRIVTGLLIGLMIPALVVDAQELNRYEIAGLDKAVEILVDHWGISHIYAETEHDLFFAQGWNAARDRLFQLELWRRQATVQISPRSEAGTEPLSS